MTRHFDHAQRIVEPGWVDDVLITGGDDEVCLRLDEAVTFGALRERIAARHAELTALGLHPGGTVSLRLPPSLDYVVNLLASWRIGAQVSLLDHRLTPYEVEAAVRRVKPQFLVSTAAGGPGPLLRGYSSITTVTAAREGKPAETGHVLLQLSSGSVGPSKLIGRTAADLTAELQRYQHIVDTPGPDERIVLLASMAHVLGLVGGLLHGLHNRVQVVLPRYLTTEAILHAVAADTRPTTILGVPFHIQLLAAAERAPRLPQLNRMTVGGELVRAQVCEDFTARYRVPLGIMYGMTEVGVIATDLSGTHRPALALAPGMTMREDEGQLLLAMPASPYVGATEHGRWVDGWLYTKDSGTVDEAAGLVCVRGRLDSQVSVGGLKVDLSEVEHALASLPGVAEVIVTYDSAIEAFVSLEHPDAETGLADAMAERLAAYKLPRRITFLTKLPRTSSGKLIRSIPALRAAAGAA